MSAQDGHEHAIVAAADAVALNGGYMSKEPPLRAGARPLGATAAAFKRARCFLLHWRLRFDDHPIRGGWRCAACGEKWDVADGG